MGSKGVGLRRMVVGQPLSLLPQVRKGRKDNGAMKTTSFLVSHGMALYV